MSPHRISSADELALRFSASVSITEEEALLAHISPYFDVKNTIYGGRGCFARAQIPKGTVIHLSRHPIGSSVARVFRKEVCTWCFGYQDGKTLKHRLHDKIYFCSQECVASFVKSDPEDLLAQTLVRVELLFAQSRGEVSDKDIPGDEDLDAEISRIWAATEKWESLLARLKPSKKAQIRPTVNDDDYCELRYVLGVLHSMYQTNKAEKLHQREEHLEEQKPANVTPDGASQLSLSGMDDGEALAIEAKLFDILHSSESQKVHRYPYLAVSYSNIYKFIRLIAPEEYLPFISIQAVRDIIGRNLTNAFGIWSPVTSSDEEREYFGFGVYPSASFFNHSCKPNVTKIRRGASYEYIAKEDIPVGAELCISYGIRESDGLKQRQDALREWFFECGCLRCTTEGKA